MIPHNRPSIGPEELAACAGVLESGWLAQGEEVRALEDEFCTFIGLPKGHGVAVSSGSAGLYLALLALNVRGKHVAAPAYSCRALTNAIELAGGEAQLLDVGGDTPNGDFEALSSSTKVAIVPHMFGIPATLPSQSSITVIEDCAQALGAEVAGRKVGTLGRIGVFSFAATKLITSGGQGGMVVSADGDIVEFVRKAREYDTVVDPHPRFNFQMTDLQAAIGRRQLARLPQLLARRERIFERYRHTGARFLDASAHDARPVRFRAVMRVSDPLGWQNRFRALGVTTIVPVLEEELLAPAACVPRAAELARSSVSLPIYPGLADESVDTIVQGLLN